MALELSRVDKVTKTYAPPPSITLPSVTAYEVALLPVQAGPTAGTVWSASLPLVSGQVSVTYAASDADPTGATIVVTGDGEVWMLAVGAPYQQAVKLERVSLRGGGTVSAPPAPALPPGGTDGQVLGIVNGALAWVHVATYPSTSGLS